MIREAREPSDWISDRISPIVPEVESLLAQLDLVLHDATRIEQVVEQARHLLRLPIENFDHRGVLG